MYKNMLPSVPYQENLVALVVDEAHCVKLWGSQFRTAFAQIGTLRSLIPTSVNVMALTATATKETFHVVSEALAMVAPTVVSLPPHRNNIKYEVLPKNDVDKFVSGITDELQ